MISVNYNPLISIIVITYNSSNYVMETLNSAKEQTYNNIELIITDDCSTDDTVDVCSRWIESNKKRFVRTELIIANRNSGISANCNRGLKESRGKWIKLIAGDDILMKTCVEENLRFIYSHNENIKVLISAGISFVEKMSLDNVEDLIYNNLFLNPRCSLKKQHSLLLENNQVFAPGCFIYRDFLIELGGFNEKYKNMEDYPLWIKIVKSGHKIFGIPFPLVYYRIRNESAFNSEYFDNANVIVKKSYWNSLQFRKDVIFPELDYISRLYQKQVLIRNKLLLLLGNSRERPLCQIVVVLFRVFRISKLKVLMCF